LRVAWSRGDARVLADHLRDHAVVAQVATYG
jgi:hypothetical protein